MNEKEVFGRDRELVRKMRRGRHKIRRKTGERG